MWHAPLCGCFCLVEATPIDNSPGLILNTNANSIEKLIEKPIPFDSRLELYSTALYYWRTQNESLSMNLNEQISHRKLYLKSIFYKFLYLKLYFPLKDAVVNILRYVVKSK
jgi:hypothetical protein